MIVDDLVLEYRFVVSAFRCSLLTPRSPRRNRTIPIDGVDEKPRMVVVRKDEGRPVVRVRGAGLPVQAAGGRVQFSTTTSGMPSNSFSLLVTRATPSEIAWAAICRS